MSDHFGAAPQEVAPMCEEIYTVPTDKVWAMHQASWTFGLIPIVFLVILGWGAVRTLRGRVLDGGSPAWHCWGTAAGLLLLMTLMSVGVWASWWPLVRATRFTIDGQGAQAVVETMQYQTSSKTSAYGAARTVVLADPADVCRVIELLRAAPATYFEPATGKSEEHYRVRFVGADGAPSPCTLEVVPNGKREQDINMVLLRVHGQNAGALHSPELCTWVADKAKGGTP